ncbi:MAG TPA: M28 family peptidase [Gemmatimonadaceae bacterium]|nr:M28 family peptidase [Gemmatimonadaceae bacterium]
MRLLPSLLVLSTALACAGQPAATPTPTPAPAVSGPAAITAADLRARLGVYAADSFRGRKAGTPDNIRATAWIAEEARRLGLQPGGDNGTFFQDVPLVTRGLTAQSSFGIDGRNFTLWTDFAPLDVGAPARPLGGSGSIFAGRLADTASLAPSAAGAGKLVIVRATPGMPIFGAIAIVGRRYPQAAGIAFANQDAAVQLVANYFRDGQASLKNPEEPADPPAQPVVLILTEATTTAILGGNADALRPGTTGKTIRGSVAFAQVTAPARNVVAILPGTDPVRRGQYVALGAHNDHIGVRSEPLDHDSLRAYNQRLHELGALDPFTEIDPAKRATIRVNVDSLHRLRAGRRDSIFNGADDDASGSVGLLEIAEAWVNAPAADRPRRSVIFVWHTAEELGLYGSEWFTDHPTIPRDSIVAQINIDMIGRGSASDVNGGGPQYLQLIGPKRLSSEYAALIERVNSDRPNPFRFDYTFDADGHPENIYCRSDHWNYARYGIPVAFFTTGSHLDYHQVSDEPQYIDYDHYTSVVSFIYEVARNVANREARLIVDKPKPDPRVPCRQ